MTKDQIKIIYKILKTNLTIAVLALLLGFTLEVVKIYVPNSLYLTKITLMTINFGLFLIIISPILRIFLELYYFIKVKNYTYICVCLLLFIIIVISIFY